jgi:hypothetical protein
MSILETVDREMCGLHRQVSRRRAIQNSHSSWKGRTGTRDTDFSYRVGKESERPSIGSNLSGVADLMRSERVSTGLVAIALMSLG